MHRLVIRAVEEFLCDTYGDAVWGQVLAGCEAESADRQASPETLSVSRDRAERLIPMAASRLDKPVAELLEDMGAWLARREPIRRLMRFSGRDFEDFVISLEELPGRARFVMPDLRMPRIDVVHEPGRTLRLVLAPSAMGWTSLFAGLVRVMADDYGALSVIEVEGSCVIVSISDDAFAAPREFRLGQALPREGDLPA